MGERGKGLGDRLLLMPPSSTQSSPSPSLGSSCVVVVVVVERLNYSRRIIIVRWADLSDFFRSFSSVKCVFLFYVQ